MSDLKDQLVKLGASNPELRKNIRPLISQIVKSANPQASLHSLMEGFLAEILAAAASEITRAGKNAWLDGNWMGPKPGQAPSPSFGRDDLTVMWQAFKADPNLKGSWAVALTLHISFKNSTTKTLVAELVVAASEPGKGNSEVYSTNLMFRPGDNGAKISKTLVDTAAKALQLGLRHYA